MDGWNQWEDEPSAGDYAIASLNLNPEGDGFVVAWGLYRIDSLDHRTLRVDASCFAGSYDYFTEFVNSRGYGGLFIAAGEEPPRLMSYLMRTLLVISVAIVAVFTAITLLNGSARAEIANASTRFWRQAGPI